MKGLVEKQRMVSSTSGSKEQKEALLMADTVSKKNNDHFINQAQQHRNVADHMRQMISLHNVFHDNLISAANSSHLSTGIQSYMNWWEAFRRHLLNHADLHEQAAGHLEQSVAVFDETDENIQQTFAEE